MSWKDDLGDLRLLDPENPEFARIVKRVWDHLEKLEKQAGDCPKKLAREQARKRMYKNALREAYSILGPRIEQPCSCEGCDCENALAAEVIKRALDV